MPVTDDLPVVDSQQPEPEAEPEIVMPETEDLPAVDSQQPEEEAEPDIVMPVTDDLPVVIDLKKNVFYVFYSGHVFLRFLFCQRFLIFLNVH